MKKIRTMINIFRRNQSGSILIEAAIFLPMLALFLVFSFETARYILINQKLSRASASLNDLLSRVESPEIQINDFINIVAQTMDPFYSEDAMRVFSNIMTKPVDSSAEIMWHYSGGGTLTATSILGTMGAIPTMPDDFTWRDNETILSTEIYYQYEPFFNLPTWDGRVLYVVSFNKPRLQNLTTLEN